jgi:PTS system N-acetylglucosamine-specific IIA component
MKLIVTSPVTGVVVGLEGVSDPVFSSAMVGPGTAVDPVRTPGNVCAPVSGVLRKLKPHAFIVVTDDGHGVLVHLGIDTIQLDGDGFQLLAAEGDHVEAGAPIVAWDPVAVAGLGLSPICPVIALNADHDRLDDLSAHGSIQAGAPLFSLSRAIGASDSENPSDEYDPAR